ncbi:MAG: glycoside hydrolase family 127 protein [Epulopiscium sp.]|nr:glycoside hydrolase family 127 protein [Candidatus Epulonipiscium sp.]
MEQVKLLNGLFKNSQQKGEEYLIYLDVDRLVAPCYEAVGRVPKKPRYGGWESREISGHSVGHFLSALSAMYIATGNKELRRKLEYTISELAYVQSLDPTGYISGFPRDCFDRVFTGDFTVARFELGGSWVPWYSIHKMYAGLIDAYVLVDIQEALDMVIKLANWAKAGLDNLTEEQFDKMLYCEHGGMCEVMADLYSITGNPDYLDLAIRFYHKETLLPLSHFKDELEGKHANTQIPKVMGAAKLYNITGEEKYKNAVVFFWNVVTQNRSYVIGGNSRDEHFGKADTEKLGVMTAETCNTYNMLKLTEILYDWEQDSTYMDYYERALYNHILASQDPDSGMKTYFVSTQPGHFKIYCSPDDSFWCCTGTGMENPARYGRRIYYRDKNDLFINLFISSEMKIEDKGIRLVQETNFPESEDIRLTFAKANGEFMNIKIRVPSWVNGEVKVFVNEEEQNTRIEKGYMTIGGDWKTGDCICFSLPMKIHAYRAKDDLNQVAFMYGPIVLAGALGKENFPETDILDDHLKLNHYPGIIVPTLVTDQMDIEEYIQPVEGLPLTFETTAIGQPGNIKCTLIPFYALHHQRYTIYWKTMTTEEYKKSQLTSLDYQEKLEGITVDSVNPNEQQPEIEHKIQSKNSNSDYFSDAGKGWRESIGDGYFSYEMAVQPNEQMYLVVTYWGSDKAHWISGKRYTRDFTISIDEVVIANEVLEEEKPYTLFDVFYEIPKELTKNKSRIEVKFLSTEDKIAGRIFGIRTTREKLS